MPVPHGLKLGACAGLAVFAVALFAFSPLATAVLLTFALATGWILMMERVVSRAVAASAVPRRAAILKPSPPDSVVRAYWDG